MRRQGTVLKREKLEPKVPRSTKSVKLTFPDGKEVSLPILDPTCGNPMIDIRALFKLSGHFTFDPGFTCTGSCASQLTFIEGAKGRLLHRGYKIEDLAENGSFMEICYLLLYGALPTQGELKDFEDMIVSEMIIHQRVVNLFKSYKAKSHPMAILVGVVGSLSAFDKHVNSYDLPEDEQIATCIKLIAKMPVIASIAYRTSLGLPNVMPVKKYGFVENFLRMMFKDPMEDWKVKPKLTRAMDKILLLHADHEQNASTSTVRIAASSNANPFSCIAAGIASLWGPMHGGANEAVVKMLNEIGSVENIPKYIAKSKDKSDSFRLMGFGHRVYKNYDPRAKIMKAIAKDILQEYSVVDPTLELAIELEKIALSDEYFIKRKLFPNVDFYTGIIYKLLGLPLEMFTVMFTVSRTSGWVCQWKEMMIDSTRKIGRPRQLYVGETERPYVPINKRKGTEDTFTKISRTANFMSLPIL